MERASFITSLTWVQRGKSKATVEKVKFTKQELGDLIKELKLKEAEYESRPDSEKIQTNQPTTDSEHETENDEYDLASYDQEPSEAISNKPIETLILDNEPDTDSEDSDAEPDEFTVKPDDNIILTGHVDDDVCMLEVFVFNNDKAELFLLHDIFLPSQPMSIEWLDFNTKDSENACSLAAVGYMSPDIHIWDLSVSGSLEPMYRLGGPKAKKSQRHEDSVLSLSWNRVTRNVLASGSADKTVRLWDLTSCVPLQKLNPFESYIQTIQWHCLESYNLLTGCADQKVRLFDCRGSNLFKSWSLEGEVEQILWDPFNPYYFFTSENTGLIRYLDVRSSGHIWQCRAHNEEAVMTISSQCESFFVTASTDEMVKVWDIKAHQPEFVAEKTMNIGSIYTIRSCPDVPYVFCAGGNKKDNYMYLWDSRDCDAVVEHFGDRNTSTVSARENSRPVQQDAIEIDTEEPTPGPSTGLKESNSTGGQIKIKSKKTNKALKAARKEARAQREAESSEPGPSSKKKRDHKKKHPKTKKGNTDE